MPDVEQRDRLMNNNQSLNEELNENGAKNNFSWSETSGVKIIRSLSDLNQALGKFILIQLYVTEYRNGSLSTINIS